jgi:hypothetical protein
MRPAYETGAHWSGYTMHRGGALTDDDVRRVAIGVLVREKVDHSAFYALLSLARAFASGRAVSKAEVAGLIAAFDMNALTAGTVWHYAATADTESDAPPLPLKRSTFWTSRRVTN